MSLNLVTIRIFQNKRICGIGKSRCRHERADTIAHDQKTGQRTSWGWDSLSKGYDKCYYIQRQVPLYGERRAGKQKMAPAAWLRADPRELQGYKPCASPLLLDLILNRERLIDPWV